MDHWNRSMVLKFYKFYYANTELFWPVFSHIQTKYGPEKTPYLDTFHAVQIKQIIQKKLIQLRVKYNQIILTCRPQVVVNEFPERQHIFKRHKIFLGEWLYSEATNSRVYNSNNIIVFSDSIASFTQNIRSNFNNHLKEGRARFKCFPVLF